MYYNKRLHPRQAQRIEIAYISDDCDVHSGSRLSLDRSSRKSSTPSREIPTRKKITVVDEDPAIRDHRFDILFCGTDRLNANLDKITKSTNTQQNGQDSSAMKVQNQSENHQNGNGVPSQEGEDSVDDDDDLSGRGGKMTGKYRRFSGMVGENVEK
ncbi:hypothetical protein DMENIID0001_126370 [Sergentomyia squamirostris]